MNILKRQLALLLVVAMTLTMLPMPAHADEVTEPESLSAIVEESTEKPMVSNEDVSTTAANKPVEHTDSDATKKENAVPAAETSKDTTMDSDTTVTEKTVAEVSEDASISDSVEEAEEIIDTENSAEDAEVEENTGSDSTVDPGEDSSAADSDESEEAEDSKADTQEELDLVEPKTDVPVAAAFSLRRSAVNAAADCEHENTTFVVDSREDYWYYLHTDTTKHIANYYTRDICDDCGETVSEVRNYFAEDHVMNENSVCTLCGYTAETDSCEHSATEVAWDTNHTVTYTPVDASQHTVEGYQYTYCTSCFERVGESFAVEETDEHELNAEGTCSLCGYSSDCDHNIIWKIVDDESLTIQKVGYIGDTQHSVSYLKWPCCTLCGLIVGASEWTPEVVEDHSFSESDWCDICSFRRNCPHENTHEEMDRNGLPGYRSVSDTQHVMFVYYFDLCWDCGNQVGERRAVDTGSYSNHTLDDSGVCTLCGYASDESTGCAHENVITGYAPLYDPPRYEQYNDTQHFVYHIFKKTCSDCGETLSEGEEAVALEDHVLDNGKCTYCGYGMGEDYCTHPASEVMWDTDYAMTYTSLNDEQHEIEGYQYHYCTSCYKRICDSFPVVEWENHTFDSAGDCTLCDYRVGCAHSQTTKKLYDTLYESVDKDSHEVTRLYSKVCADPDCGKVLVSVETSYTETETEDHDFDGNTCTLCGYTVAAQLSATVTASSLTANKGDHISATVSVVGGTGGYRYSWKVIKDGSVKAESPITTDTSYDYLANEEGSYVFQVTVTDSGGNTVTAQSGAIAVKHACQYETVTSTELVIQSETHHTVETTTYEECSVCHAKTEEVKDVEWVEHTPMNKDAYGYETSHDNYHQKYFICECGAHPYLEGQYETANGKVQEPEVCCICNGHKYGEAEEASDGTWKKTCVNCGLSQKVAVSVQPTAPEDTGCDHVFNYDTIVPSKHPHTVKRVCMRCQTVEHKNLLVSDCCQCVGHDWGKVTRLPDGKTYKVGCFRCNKYQEVIPSNDIEDFYTIVDIITERHNAAKDYHDKHELDSSSSAIWKTIAGQATDKLSEGGFVGVNEVLNTYSDMTGSIKGVFEEDDWNQQQIDLWESLLIELLKKEYKAEEESSIKSEDIDYWSGIVGTVEKTSEFVAEQLEDNKDAIQKSINELDEWILEAEENANILLRDGDILASNDMLNKSHKLRDLKAEYEESMESTGKGASSTAKWMKGTALLMDAASIIAAGTEAESAVRDRNNALMDLLKNDQTFVVLSSIIASADAAGEDNLKEAAKKLKKDLEIAQTEAFSDFFSENDAFWKGAGLAFLEKVGDKAGEKAFNYALTKGLEKAGVKAAGTVVKDSLFFLSAIESGAKGLKAIVDWGDAYTEAQKLMTINYMDTRLNVVNFVLEQKDPYIADLWGMLNAEGCVQAQVFLKAWEDGTGLNSKDFGIDNGGWFRDSELPVVLDQLDEERDFYIDELDLPLEKSK